MVGRKRVLQESHREECCRNPPPVKGGGLATFDRGKLLSLDRTAVVNYMKGKKGQGLPPSDADGWGHSAGQKRSDEGPGKVGGKAKKKKGEKELKTSRLWKKIVFDRSKKMKKAVGTIIKLRRKTGKLGRLPRSARTLVETIALTERVTKKGSC